MTTTICIVSKFLSTLSLRRATSAKSTPEDAKRYFYPRSPCGERRDVIAEMTEAQSISIHALLAESDGVHFDNFNLHCVISIHALLAESDRQQPAGEKQRTYFYPRSPCGERQTQTQKTPHFTSYFYPRSPCGERRASSQQEKNNGHISIHALLAESDIVMVGLLMFNLYFYPRSPCGERP